MQGPQPDPAVTSTCDVHTVELLKLSRWIATHAHRYLPKHSSSVRVRCPSIGVDIAALGGAEDRWGDGGVEYGAEYGGGGGGGVGEEDGAWTGKQ